LVVGYGFRGRPN